MIIKTDNLRVGSNTRVDLSKYPTESDLKTLDSEQTKLELSTRVDEFSNWQELLFAEKKQSLLVIFQGMDASGKDSTIKKVASGVNPQGLRVFNFDKPTSTDLSRSYLHRHWVHFPQQGFIVFFNRSHYEEVLVVRVHPDILVGRNFDRKTIDKSFWRARYEDIVATERHLVRNNTTVVKIYLHLSRDRQQKRLKSRIQKPEKHWKFDPSDLRERIFWDDYQTAYNEAISSTSTDDAPWFIVPADHKPSLRLIVAEIIVQALRRMNPKIPKITEEKQKIIDYYRSDGTIE